MPQTNSLGFPFAAWTFSVGLASGGLVSPGRIRPTRSCKRPGDLQAIYISADWFRGDETTTLDNVRLAGIRAVPEPDSLPVFAIRGKPSGFLCGAASWDRPRSTKSVCYGART